MDKKGFTLAEVLITLGIIGIVAAMTIPTLVSKYQEKAYVTQLKNLILFYKMLFSLLLLNTGLLISGG